MSMMGIMMMSLNVMMNMSMMYSLAEYLSEAEIMEAVGGASAAEYLRDEHGHLRLDEVDLGGIIKRELQNRFGTRKQKVTIIAKKLGYELRCADPIPFDVEYCRDLGMVMMTDAHC